MMLNWPLKESVVDDAFTIKIITWLIGLNNVYMYHIDSLHTLMYYLKVPICLICKITWVLLFDENAKTINNNSDKI